jgi:hypothetical protein
MKAQQQRIEDLTGRVIRLEAQLELLTAAALVKKDRRTTRIVLGNPHRKRRSSRAAALRCGPRPAPPIAT